MFVFDAVCVAVLVTVREGVPVEETDAVCDAVLEGVVVVVTVRVAVCVAVLVTVWEGVPVEETEAV